MRQYTLKRRAIEPDLASKIRRRQWWAIADADITRLLMAGECNPRTRRAASYEASKRAEVKAWDRGQTPELGLKYALIKPAPKRGKAWTYRGRLYCFEDGVKVCIGIAPAR